MDELLEHLEYVFNNPVKVKYKKTNVLTFTIEYGLLNTGYVETDGTMTMNMEDNKYIVTIHDYTYLLLIHEAECSFDSCSVYINKLRQDEGVANIKRCLQYF